MRNKSLKERNVKGDADIDQAAKCMSIGSLAKGLQLLEILLDAPAPLALADLASATNQDSSTVHRLLQVLIGLGYVVRDSGSKRYLPSPRSLIPLSVFHPLQELRRESQFALHSLRESTGETSAIAIFVGAERLVVDVARGAQPLAPYYDTWLKSPLHGSASGKILLASLPLAERNALLGGGPYKAWTSMTTVDPDKLHKYLDKTLEQGYAAARDDAHIGIIAIGAPLYAAKRTVGSLVLTADSSTVSVERERELGLVIKSAAEALSWSAPSLRAVRHLTGRAIYPRTESAPNLLSSETNNFVF